MYKIGNLSRWNNSYFIFALTLSVFSVVAIYNVVQWEIAKEKIPTMHSLDLITGDEPHNLSITSEIIRHHNVYMEEYFNDEPHDPSLIWPSDYYNNTLLWQSYQRPDGHYINVHPNGLPLLLIPGYAIGGILGSMITMSVMSSLTSVFIYKFTRKLTTPKTGFFTTLLVSFSTLLFTYSNQIYADVVITLFLIASLYFILEKHRNGLHMAAVGVILGYGIFLKISFILIDVILIPLIFIMFFKHQISLKNFSLFCIVFALFVTLSIVNNMYTNNSVIGGAQTTSVINIFFTGKDQTGIFGAGAKIFGLTSIIESFFGKYHGMFIFSPILMLSTIGIKPLWDKNKQLVIIITLLSISIITGYTLTDPENILFAGDPPSRYFVPLIPLMGIAVACGFEKFSRRISYRILLIILTALSSAFSLAFAYNRIFSVDHALIKGKLVHLIYFNTDFFFPSLGTSIKYPMHHPLDIYNEIFLVSIVSLLVLGIMLPFLFEKKVIR